MEIDTQLLYPADQVLLGLMIFLIMLGMGSSLTTDDFRSVYKHARGVFIGFLSQFGLMPLVAFALATLLELSPAQAIALIMIGCLPGGTTSNMFAYFARGSIALSIAMTTASTILALVMMPLLLEFYAAGYTQEITRILLEEGRNEPFVIPRWDIVSSLLLVLVPVGMGMLLKRQSPGWAKTAEDTAGFLGILVILYLVGTAFARHSALFLQTPATLYISAVCIGLLGFFFGYRVSKAAGVPPIYRRSIALETGIQNTPVAFAIILLSFSNPIQDQMIWLAILYATFIIITSSLVTLYFRHKGKFDWEVYKNTTIHNRLFGSDYVTNYPDGFLPSGLKKDPSQGTQKAQQR